MLFLAKTWKELRLEMHNFNKKFHKQINIDLKKINKDVNNNHKKFEKDMKKTSKNNNKKKK